MQLIVVSDIFGKTAALENLVARISANFTSTLLLDPYEGNGIPFLQEQEAYSYFRTNIGLPHYTQTVVERIKQRKTPSFLLGFSIGASVVWTISQERIFHPCTKAVGFYGSQIRNLVDVNPVIEIDMYFPRHEPHFDVLELIEKISQKPLVRCSTTDYLHGFMNERSENFDKAGYLAYLTLLKKEAARLVSHTRP